MKKKHPIEALIEQGEHQQLDFKFEVSDSKKIARTLSAFANTDGGRLLIGVKDNGAISGVRSEEEYYMIEAASKMYTHPEVVHAVTRRVVDFLVSANTALLRQTAPYLSAGFFGNDLGTQISMMVSLDCFDEFILPSVRRIADTIRQAGLPVAFHSCGAIEPLIPRLIDAGVELLHPLQARARGMDAETLASRYRGRLIFMGGVDTQQLLPFGTPEQVRAEVLRLRGIFGDDFIVSPSHEALLPNVPFENAAAMSRAAKE